MPRKPRHYLAGVPAHVVQRGNNRQACFFSEEDYAFYLACLREAAKRFGCAVHAYCLMTNHVHVLLTPENEAGISQLIQSLGRRYVRYVNAVYRRSGTLWEGRHKGVLVESESYLLTCYRYIELNPVRANMVVHPAMYPYSSYGTHALAKPDSLVRDHALYTQLGATPAQRQRAYCALFEAHLDETTLRCIREATQFGVPLGNTRFRTEIEAALGRRVGYARRGRPKKPTAVVKTLS